VDQLYVFQRTAAWLTHRFNHRMSPFMKWLHKKLPFTLTLRREGQFWFHEFLGLSFMGATTINRVGRWVSLMKLKHEVKDPETRKKLTPDYTIGCKRILRSDDYWPAFNRDNVHLITDPVSSLYSHGIETSTGERIDVDVIIYCTGFNVADFNYPIRILNAEGRELFQTLRQTSGAAYKGTVVAGFPNLFLLMGPNTGLGHNSVVHMMESQMNYVVSFLKALDQQGDKAYASVRPEVQQRYVERIRQQLQGTVWYSGCNSWYLDENGHNSTLYPRLNTHFRKETRKFDPAELEIFS
jgi:cation diffusion facilitator CzcD-associated flavoprotein CzcO